MPIIMNELNWVGSSEPFIDRPHISELYHITLGRYGGHSLSGAKKNEDGCLVWACEKGDWEFSAILDAHYSAESAELVVKGLEGIKAELAEAIDQAVPHCFKELETRIVTLFKSTAFRDECRRVKGETACLLVFRKENYVWWLSIGDCVLYLFHPELAAFDQYQLNQRNFYEWIGRVNTFEKPVPCFSSGTRELRKGKNTFLLATDGMTECPGTGYANAKNVYRVFEQTENPQAGVHHLLKAVEQNGGRDSATLIGWQVDCFEEGSEPSNGRVRPELRQE
ncbi:protein phosphatase 2C domain-containing protein [Fictibacillus fluitans]|uniref:Protein phosphatase 2C domain-containing protein n=1 Tax=Fictibacillus fluitans TaxID=3058422 RepID=A0ABT8HUK9_9BACL|nr:protein phosphatase 2C domain-containing protein [Fictibacillus sp. NE201]MDN4524467.1 protein phosphatase 2C domain-containing protein [Fictibacillus sp. NE201]